jgi:hypothetical protein
MTTRLYNGPICMVKNWFVDIDNDGTLARTAAESSSPTNTYSPHPSHHTHHSYHTHHLHPAHPPAHLSDKHRPHTHHHTHHTKHQIPRVKVHDPTPVRLMIYDPKKVLRLLHTVAALKARRDNLVLLWETYDEMRDQNKKTLPDHSGRPETLKGALFGGTIVETGEIYAILRSADKLTSTWMQEFVAESSKDTKSGWDYLLKKTDEGHEHMQGMAEVYHQAYEANEHSRHQLGKVVKALKFGKLGCDVTLKIVGALPGVNIIGMGIEMGYELVSGHLEEKPAHAVGMLSKDAKTVGTELFKEGLKQADEHMEKGLEHEVEELILKNLGMSTEQFAEKLAKLDKVAAERAAWVWRNWDKGRVSMGELHNLMTYNKVLEYQRSRYLKAMQWAKKAKALGKVANVAHWVFVAGEVKEKLHEAKELWEEDVDDY